jgi:hypothetical protein
MLRVGDVALVDLPASDSGPRCINCYSVEVDGFDAIGGYKFKLDPQCLLYSLQWLHNGTPPDLHLALAQELPAQWVNASNLTLLSALRRGAPQAIHWDAMADVVPVLDAFEAAQESRMARQH